MQTGDDRSVLLSTMPATRRDRAAALAVVGVSSILFACAVPFAGVPLAPMPAFVASYQSALAINDLITAVLLFSQFAILRSRALLLLASGYLFTAAAAIVHALTFPGLFAPAGLLYAGPQTTAWLYKLWHGGFLLFVLGYALLKGRPMAAPRYKVDRQASRSSEASLRSALRYRSLTWIVTAGHDALPTLLNGGRFTTVRFGIVSVVLLLNLAALAGAVVSATAFRARRLAHGRGVRLAVRHRAVGGFQRGQISIWASMPAGSTASVPRASFWLCCW